MSCLDYDGESFYLYAIELFSKTGHVSASNPKFVNHSSEQFIYFDNKSNITLTYEQRSMVNSFNNVSCLFTINDCTFFSINLLTTKGERSQLAHDIHTMIHPIINAKGTICLFRFDEEVMLSLVGYGYRCVLSDWYLIEDNNSHLLERLDIANMSIDSGAEYFSDMVYCLARSYYLCGQPSVYEILPIDFISSAGIDEIDREALDKYIEYEMNAPLRIYGDDYVEYSNIVVSKTEDISVDLSLMLLEMDEEIESDDEFDMDESFNDNVKENERDIYEFDDVDPKIFDDPTLMVKWLEKNYI